MSTSKPSTWQVCATCTHWAGSRDVSTFRDRVEYDSDRVRGECVGGGWNRTERSPSATCSQWVKWSVLK